LAFNSGNFVTAKAYPKKNWRTGSTFPKKQYVNGRKAMDSRGRDVLPKLAEVYEMDLIELCKSLFDSSLVFNNL
jgi:hypothetical protein